MRKPNPELWDDLDGEVQDNVGHVMAQRFGRIAEPVLRQMGFNNQGVCQFYRWFGQELIRRADNVEPELAALDAMAEAKRDDAN